MNRNISAAIPKVTAVLPPEAGAPLLPCPCAEGAGIALAAAGLGTGGSFGAGAGQVTKPSLMTVRPRMASSSILTLMMPSLVLHNSSVRRNRLVPYRVEDCLAKRLFRSV